MFFRNLLTFLGIMGFSASPVSAQEAPTTEPVAIAATITSEFPSSIVGDIFKIDVAVPYTYLESDKRFPVIYLTDSNGYFPFVVGNLRMLQLNGEMPEVIIVGIGYANPSVASVIAKRSRDLSPTFLQEFYDRAISNPYLDHPKDIKPGGGPKFQEFIETELKPVINQIYRTNPSDETLMGYSFGGLFTTYVLFNHTNTFDKYVIGSPSLWWDDRICFDYEEAYAATNKDLPKRVFMSVGELEGLESGSTMKSYMQEMSERLEGRNYPNLIFKSHVFEGETHQSGIGTALNRGLRFTFKDQIPQPPALQNEAAE